MKGHEGKFLKNRERKEKMKKVKEGKYERAWREN